MSIDTRLIMFFRVSLVGLLCLPVIWLCGVSSMENDFYQSFIASYDLSGRYTHEYHPFILKKTRDSFIELEQSLGKANFLVDGHMLIIGYQEDAIPPYATYWSRQALEDEVIVKTTAGLSQPTKNIFGYMTGFLLKDAQWLEEFWFKDGKQGQVIHIAARPIDLFNDSAVIFQKHAFGKDFGILIKARNGIEAVLYKKDLRQVLDKLITFWSTMYERASTTGSQEIVGTQDVLFSIDYARALLEGNASIKKVFVGPDITYPIEVLSCQKVQATAHAQKFIQCLQEYLQPVDNKKTAYIFCSFVDGVGKSTLLNNIRNWGNYGNQFDKYERCDNSSSQEATLFELKDNVCIVDLPAQISHYTIKPDGFVYVDVRTVPTITASLKNQVIADIHKNKAELIRDFLQIKARVACEDKALYEDPNPVAQYALNCTVMDIKDPLWIPYSFNDHQFLFNKDNPENLRVLVTLAGAHSIGLKVVEPEQMLFSNGLSLPMLYESFVNDLKQKLTNAGVEHVLFVDFLSMYPRSSRENIRVNFVLQYLKKIFGQHYKIEDSFYQHKVHREQEICHLLCNRIESVIKILGLEAALRGALHTLLEDKPAEWLNSIKGRHLEQALKDSVVTILSNYQQELYEYSYKRLYPEQTIYYQNYALDRIYETIIRFSPSHAIMLSEMVVSLWTRYIKHPYMLSLWAGMDGALPKISAGMEQRYFTLDNGIEVEAKYRAHALSKDGESLKEMIKTIRAQWYGTLTNLLNITINEDEYQIEKIEQHVPPLALKLGDDNYIYTIQRRLPLIDMTNQRVELPTKFNIVENQMRTRSWGLFDKAAHCMEWDNNGTFSGIYAYGYSPEKSSSKNIVTQLVDQYRQTCMQNNRSNWCMPTSELYNQINSQQLWDKIKEEVRSLKQGKMQTIAAYDSRIPGICLWVRIVATIDMVLKDMRSEIIVRKGNKQDFVAALKLLETITLPSYFGITCAQPLFADYDTVDPVISWNMLADKT
jgi:hypothetical protein